MGFFHDLLFGRPRSSRAPAKRSSKGAKVVGGKTVLDLRYPSAEQRRLGLETLAQTKRRTQAERIRNERAATAAARAHKIGEAEVEKRRKLLEAASKARTKTAAKQYEAKAQTAGKRADAAEDTADTILRLVEKRNNGERLTSNESDELRRAMAGGVLGLRRNPRTNKTEVSRRVSDVLEKARAMSEEFHDTPDEVVELEPDELKPPARYGVVIGSIKEIVYGPDHHSKRGADLWNHTLGDRGFGQKTSKEEPLLVADPLTKRVHIVQHRSPLKFDPSKGLVG